MIAKIILYAVQHLNKKDTVVGKTFMQKLLYLFYDKEQRNSLYIPYFFGPYSEMTQLLLNSMINKGYLNYEDKKFSIPNELIINGTIFTRKEKESKEKTDKIMLFLEENHLNTTREISNFSKTFMILSNNEDYKDDKALLVKNRSRLLGWEELSKLSNSHINNYVEKYIQFNETISI